MPISDETPIAPIIPNFAKTCSLVVLKGPFMGRRIDLEAKSIVLGRSMESDVIVGTARDGTSRKHARIYEQDGDYWVEDLGSTNGVFVNSQRCKCGKLSPGDLLSLGRTVLKVVGDVDELDFHETLYHMAVCDDLTGLLKRAEFETYLRREIPRCRRLRLPLCLLFVDLDYFKQINDTFGHLAGDVVLRGIGQLFRDNLRKLDLAGRYGGDEFVVMLRETDMDEALQVAERLRQQVEAKRFAYEGESLKITLSMGVAEYSPHVATAEALLMAADEALLGAKREGRNRVSAPAKELEETERTG